MKILAIVGSPRQGGNTATLVERALEGARQKGASVETIVLNDLNIGYCIACDACKELGRCKIEDDMNGVAEKMKAADTLLLAAPVYWGDITAQMKAWIDRSYCMMDMEMKTPLNGKKGGIIVVCGEPGDEAPEHALQTLNTFCLGNQMTLVDCLKAPGLLEAGAVKDKEDLLKGARALGEKLAQG